MYRTPPFGDMPSLAARNIALHAWHVKGQHHVLRGMAASVRAPLRPSPSGLTAPTAPVPSRNAVMSPLISGKAHS